MPISPTRGRLAWPNAASACVPHALSAIPQRAAGQGQQHAFGEQLADQRPAAAPKAARMALSFRRPMARDKKQRRYVGAGDQQ